MFENLQKFKIILTRGEAAKLAHLFESVSLKENCMNKNYEKICIE